MTEVTTQKAVSWKMNTINLIIEYMDKNKISNFSEAVNDLVLKSLKNNNGDESG